MTTAAPLTRSQRGRAAVAATVCTVLFDLGVAGFAIVAFFVALVVELSVWSTVADPSVDSLDPTSGFSLATGIPAGGVPAVLVGSGVAAALCIAAAIILSIQILRRGGLTHARGITWSALASSQIAAAILGGIVSIALGVGSNPTGSPGMPVTTTATTDLIDTFGVTVVVGIVLAWLVWWLMAHLMRNRMPDVVPTSSVTPLPVPVA